MNVQERLKQFIENTEIRDMWYDKKEIRPTGFSDVNRLFKIQFGDFDYIYGMENIRNNKPTDYSKPHFCGAIHRQTNELYTNSYNITDNFENIKYTKFNKLNEKLIEMLKQAYEKFAENVIDDLPDNAIYYRMSDTENAYYTNKLGDFSYSLNLHERDINELLTFEENPTEYIKSYIEDLEKEKKLTTHIKEVKLQRRLKSQNLKEIETSPDYHYLRLARKLNIAIPENAKTVNLFYKLNNGEIIECKYETSALGYIPYGKNETLHFSGFSVNKQARDKIEEVNGRKYDDIYIKNITKITYKGKTLYENND